MLADIIIFLCNFVHPSLDYLSDLVSIDVPCHLVDCPCEFSFHYIGNRFFIFNFKLFLYS